jgi:hypothetical protein
MLPEIHLNHCRKGRTVDQSTPREFAGLNGDLTITKPVGNCPIFDQLMAELDHLGDGFDADLKAHAVLLADRTRRHLVQTHEGHVCDEHCASKAEVFFGE